MGMLVITILLRVNIGRQLFHGKAVKADRTGSKWTDIYNRKREPKAKVVWSPITFFPEKIFLFA